MFLCLSSEGSGLKEGWWDHSPSALDGGTSSKKSPFAGILPQSQHFPRNCCIFGINLECFCLANPLLTMGLVKPSTPAAHCSLFLPRWLLQVYNPDNNTPSHFIPFEKSCFSILLLLVACSVPALCSHPFAARASVGILWRRGAGLSLLLFSPGPLAHGIYRCGREEQKLLHRPLSVEPQDR